MKYFALKAVMFVYYLAGIAAFGLSLFYFISISSFGSTVNPIGVVIGVIVGIISATSFVAFAQLVQLILDMKAEQSEQTKLMQFQANALKRMLSDR